MQAVRPSSTRTQYRQHQSQLVTLNDRLRSWLASDALQGPDGAYHAWLDPASGQRAFAYPEITGYALTYLAGRPNPTEQETVAARRAATWLSDRLDRGDWSARDNWDNRSIYTFDLGMIAAGLINVGCTRGMERHRATGMAVAQYLAKMVDQEGRMPAVIRGHHASAERPASWSTVGQPHMAKTVQCLLLAADEGDASCGDAAERMMRRTMSLQQADGRFVTQDDHTFTMLHPHLYTIEALWMWAMSRDDRLALESADAALDWAWKHQLSSGGFPRSAPALTNVRDIAPTEQFDATAQTLRMAVMLRPNSRGIVEGCTRLMEMSQDTDQGAALPYQGESGSLHLNAWATMFGSQALDVATHGPAAMTWQFLV